MERRRYLGLVETQLRVHPICAILGPRQVGKTTLARAYAEKHGLENAYFFDLEDPIQKRQVKLPKIYFRDSGILHTLSGIENYEQLLRFPKLGAYWEGFALEEIIRALGLATEECFFWSTHGEAELDLLVVKQGKRIGFEFKYMDAPRVTKSIHSALEDLKLDHVILVYPGNKHFPLADKVTVCGLELIATGEFQQMLAAILGA